MNRCLAIDCQRERGSNGLFCFDCLHALSTIAGDAYVDQLVRDHDRIVGGLVATAARLEAAKKLLRDHFGDSPPSPPTQQLLLK